MIVLKIFTLVLCSGVFENSVGETLPDTEICGKSDVPDELTNGDSELGAFPWVGFLVDKNRPKMRQPRSVVLISNRYALTTGYCVTKRFSLARHIRFGAIDVIVGAEANCTNGLCSDGSIEVEIEEVLFHPNYNKPRHRNNIAVVQFANEIQFSENVRPICLPSAINDNPILPGGEKLLVVGWGAIRDRGMYHEKQQSVALESINNTVCANTGVTRFTIEDSELCTRVEREGDPDACVGFSGSPVMRKLHDNWIVEGLVSVGFACNSRHFPGVNVNVRFYEQWIREITG